MAKGYRQRQGIDYDETFSLLAMLKSIRILLAIGFFFFFFFLIGKRQVSLKARKANPKSTGSKQGKAVSLNKKEGGEKTNRP